MFSTGQLTALHALGDGNEDHYMHKFTVRPGYWIGMARRIADGQAENIAGRINVLDIGCGFPYFGSVLQDRGHTVAGVDVADGMIEAAAAILDVPFAGLTIEANRVLPRVISGYDLVTTFGVNFRHGCPSTSTDYWDIEEYRFLANDIRVRLNPGGAWWLRPNTEKTPHTLSRQWWRQIAGPDAFIYVHGKEVWIEWPRS